MYFFVLDSGFLSISQFFFFDALFFFFVVVVSKFQFLLKEKGSFDMDRKMP